MKAKDFKDDLKDLNKFLQESKNNYNLRNAYAKDEFYSAVNYYKKEVNATINGLIAKLKDYEKQSTKKVKL